MPAYQGTYFTAFFTIKDADSGDPVDISNWEFESDIRDRRDDSTPLLTLTTANGGWSVLDGPNGRLQMSISASQTAQLPAAKLVFDVLRTDVSPGPTYVFGGRFNVRQPVTRDE